MIRRIIHGAMRSSMDELLREPLRGIHAQLDTMREDMRDIKDHIRGIKDDLRGKDADIRGLKDDIRDLKNDFRSFRGDTNARFDRLETRIEELAAGRSA